MRRLMRRMIEVFPVALALAACETATTSSSTPLQSPGVANIQPQDDDTVVERVADARCGRANACGDVGPAARYASREACLKIMRQRAARDIHPSECDRGPDVARIDRCVAEILTERCGDPYANFAHFGACRQAQICAMR